METAERIRTLSALITLVKLQCIVTPMSMVGVYITSSGDVGLLEDLIRRYHMHLQKTLRVLFNTRLGKAQAELVEGACLRSLE